MPKVYWTERGKEQCIVGCFRGNLDQLEAKVISQYPETVNKHHQDYMRWITAVREYQKLMEVKNDLD